MKYSIEERVNMAIKLAIAEEEPKLKEGQTLKVEVLQTDEGMQVNVYPVDSGNSYGNCCIHWVGLSICIALVL